MPGESELRPWELTVLGRKHTLFDEDLRAVESLLSERVRTSSFLVLGGAGTIGQAVVKELFHRNPQKLHVIDLSENNLAELVRDLRSSYGYIGGDFRTFALDCGAPETTSLLRSSRAYDFVLNLSAMKHVRSERDPFTLMRLVRTNVINTRKSLELAVATGVKHYFAVSSDKAVHPANAMGASKRIMELCLIGASGRIRVSSARFANVAFSDGSLLHGFVRRLDKRQPLAAPVDVRRYFVTASEAAFLCLLACLFGGNRECMIPLTSDMAPPAALHEIAESFLKSKGYVPHSCSTESEARSRVEELAARGEWPCYFAASDTTGEKPLEEFRRRDETVDKERFRQVGVITWPRASDHAVETFVTTMESLRERGIWTREEILQPMKELLPDFRHLETGRFLDERM